MLEMFFGWYMKKELGCAFDMFVFTETVTAGDTKAVTIAEATESDRIKSKFGGNNFIITKMFSACFPTSNPVVCDIMPDGDSTDRFFQVACSPRDECINPPISLESDIEIEYTNGGGADANVFIGFDGFWLPVNMLHRFDEIATAVVGMEEAAEIPAPRTMAQTAMVPEGGVAVPYCERRRL